MQRILLTPPAAQPVSAAEGMAAAALDEAHWIPRVEAAIAEGVEIAEHETSRRLMRQTWRYPLAAWPTRADVLPEYQPATVAITYRSTVGVWETLSPVTYIWGPVEGGIVVVPVNGQIWPEAQPDELGHAVRIDISSGADTPSAVPAAARNFVLGVVALRVPGANGDQADKHLSYLLRGLDSLRLYK